MSLVIQVSRDEEHFNHYDVTFDSQCRFSLGGPWGFISKDFPHMIEHVCITDFNQKTIDPPISSALACYADEPTSILILSCEHENSQNDWQAAIVPKSKLPDGFGKWPLSNDAREHVAAIMSQYRFNVFQHKLPVSIKHVLLIDLESPHVHEK